MKSCDRYAASIVLHARNELPAAEVAAVEAHLERCGRCRRLIGELSHVHALLADEQSPEPSPPSSEEVQRALARWSGARKRAQNLRIFAAFATGALTSLAFLAAWFGTFARDSSEVSFLEELSRGFANPSAARRVLAHDAALKARDRDAVVEHVVRRTGIGPCLLVADGPTSPFAKPESFRNTDGKTLAQSRLEWVRETRDFKRVLARAGILEIDVVDRAPTSLGVLRSYSLVIVIAYNLSVGPPFAKVLEQYLKEGGSIVLVAGVPSLLATVFGPGKDVLDHVTSMDLSSIAPFFGAGWYGNGEGGSILRATTRHPLGFEHFDDVDLSSFYGESKPLNWPAAVDGLLLDGTTTPVAKWQNGMVFAFARRDPACGGRLYYQAFASDFRHPEAQRKQIEELFLRGCVWAAGGFAEATPSGPRSLVAFHAR